MTKLTTNPNDGTWTPIFEVHASELHEHNGSVYLLTYAGALPPFVLGDADDRYAELAHIIDSTAADAEIQTRVDRRARELRTIAGLMSESGENPEYDRACVEIARDLIGLDWEDDTRTKVETLLRSLRTDL